MAFDRAGPAATRPAAYGGPSRHGVDGAASNGLELNLRYRHAAAAISSSTISDIALNSASTAVSAATKSVTRSPSANAVITANHAHSFGGTATARNAGRN